MQDDDTKKLEKQIRDIDKSIALIDKQILEIDKSLGGKSPRVTPNKNKNIISEEK